MSNFQRVSAVGRRKTSIARVWLSRIGSRSPKNTIMVNGRPYDQYFPSIAQQHTVSQPILSTDSANRYIITIRAHGGGISGQAGAVRMGIARAVSLADPSAREVLRKNGYLSRDGRRVERKKPGRRKARRSFQFSKR